MRAQINTTKRNGNTVHQVKLFGDLDSDFRRKIEKYIEHVNPKQYYMEQVTHIEPLITECDHTNEWNPKPYQVENMIEVFDLIIAYIS